MTLGVTVIPLRYHSSIGSVNFLQSVITASNRKKENSLGEPICTAGAMPETVNFRGLKLCIYVLGKYKFCVKIF